MNTMYIHVTRDIRAIPEDVFRAWIDPERMHLWFGTTRQIVDPRVDGLFFLEMEHQGRKWPHYGRYLRIEKPGLVEFTWMSEGTHGKESIVTVEMEPKEGGTALTLTHSGVPDTDLGHGHHEGWTSIVAGIAKALE